MPSSISTPIRRASPVVLVALLSSLALGACAATVAPAASQTSAAGPSAQASASPAGTPPDPTAVPGAQTIEPEPDPTGVPTTQTEWGEILDAVPEGFPVHPDAGLVDGSDGPVSQALTVPVTVDVAATWYRDALAGEGYSVELASPLEDGSRVLDATSDLPECRIRIDFRPAAESTIISVLYAAGCGGLGS